LAGKIPPPDSDLGHLCTAGAHWQYCAFLGWPPSSCGRIVVQPALRLRLRNQSAKKLIGGLTCMARRIQG
ncbi:MAG TPA: hypothetical protein VIT23_18550, partial [Terrimicrobiaceae bacterium]